ncbi:MAG: PaaI family thioesterase [Deltaproteobacteria bacterium]|nr:PaaI family thioesterase [Deltaproteobacteria bacterium]
MALLKETAYLRIFGAFKIPMIFFVKPSVIELTDRRAVVKVPLTFRTKNHWGSMYFGVLCTGADCAGGIMAMKLIDAQKENKISLVFKDFKAEFLKRPMSDVHFICDEGDAIQELVKKTVASGERENLPVHITAICPKSSEDPVARFTLTLSLKSKAKAS